MEKIRNNNKEERPSSVWLMSLLFIFLGVIVILMGIYFNKQYQNATLKERNLNLDAVAASKAESVNKWIRTNLRNAKFLQENILLKNTINDFICGKEVEKNKKFLAEYLQTTSKFFGAKQIALVDNYYNKKLSLNLNDTILTRSFTDDPDSKILSYSLFLGEKSFDRMTVKIPIFKTNSQYEAAGFLFLGFDLNESLYPQLNESGKRTSIENLIVLKSHDSLIYLSNRKFPVKKRSAQSRSVLPETPQVFIAKNKEGFVEGIDYRGVRVMSAIHRIPGPPEWFMVSKIDRKEVLVNLHNDTKNVTLIITLLMLAVMGILASMFRSQRYRFYHKLYRAEKEKQILTQHFEYILKYANDLIFLLDKDLNILEINDRVIDVYGYQRKEIISMPIINLRIPSEQGSLKDQYDKLILSKSLTYQTVHRRKDGSEFPVEMSVRIVDVDGETFIQSIGRDITERKKQESVLSNLVQRYNLALSAANMGVWNWDFTNGKLTWDDTAAEIYGYRCDEGINGEQQWISILHPEDRDRARERARFAINDVSDYNDEHRIIRPNGTEMFVKSYGRVMRDASNKPVSMAGVTIDITAQKHAMDLLKEREFWLIESQKRGRIGSFSLDITNNKWVTSQALDDIMGVAKETNKTIQTLNGIIHPSYREEMTGYFTDTVINQKQSFDKEFKIIKQDTGEARWILGRGGVSEDKDKKNLLMIGTMQDITERKEAEEALRKSNNKINTIINNLKGVIFSCVNDQDRTMRYISDGIFELTGYEPDEFIDNTTRSFRSVIFPSDQKRVWDDIEEALKKDSTYTIEYRINTSTGAIKWVWERGRGYYEGREIKTIEGFITDITDRKFVEEELIKAKEKAEESDRLKTAFLHNISHEIRTPMNAIVGFTTLLDTPALEEDLKRQYMDIIYQSSNQLLSIITDIVDISNIEVGQVKVSAGVVNINALLKTLYEQFDTRAKQQGVHLEYVAALPDESSLVVTDSTKLIQVLTNLISNALKFTPKGSIEYGYACKGHDLEFYVKDTGIGIDKEKHNKIFERFFQVENVYTKQFSGTGLGLAISKAYVELLGGKIWLKSEIGEGSAFFFTIPHDNPGIKKTAINTNQKKEMTRIVGKTILVAEDDRINFLLIREILTKTGVNIIWAANGEEAVQVCRNNDKVDLVLMDIKMPLMDGYEATRIIRGFRPALPIIALTAYAQASDKERALAEGCVGHISKPVDRGELYSMLQQFI
jgi:PAS domain S-box-containing protein